MIAGATGGFNGMGVFKNVQACRCAQYPARPQTCCPSRGGLLLDTRAPADARKIILRQPYVRHPSTTLEGLLFWCRLARGAFASPYRSYACAGSFARRLDGDFSLARIPTHSPPDVETGRRNSHYLYTLPPLGVPFSCLLQIRLFAMWGVIT
jgi:hypothetical protein